MQYKSRYDVAITSIVIFAILLINVIGLLFYWINKGSLFFIGTIIQFLSIVIVLFFFQVSYILEDKSLLIKIFFIKIHVDYDAILEIKKTKNAYSSLATSLRRIGLRRGNNKKAMFGYLYVSPQNEDQFIEVLTKKCLNLEKN